jgi:polysaccharide pyruvyl transferase WcaK-like protein
MIDEASGPTIAFLSPCGWGNLGDAAIVDSLIAGVRRRLPGARIVGFTLNPADTTARHGIEAFTCAAYSLPFYPAEEPGPARSGPPEPAAGWSAAVKGALARVPIQGPLRTALLAPLRLRREPAHSRLSRERLRGASALLVAGGGQLDATWGGALGHPWVLWRWARLARETGARFLVASVGTGTLGPVSRALVVRALRLAGYRSFRDAVSRDLVRAPALTADDPVVPDLAYAVPAVFAAAPAGPRLVVGLSPMNFAHPRHWPERSAARYRRHVASFGQLAARVVREGHTAAIFTTDRDGAAVDDLVAAAGDLPAEARSRLQIRSTPTVAALFEALAGMDLVVAARLHGVLLAHVARRPVLAVAHERKVRTLMEETGQREFCVGIDGFDAGTAWDLLQRMAGARAELTAQIDGFVRSCAARVERQYDALLTPTG